LNESEFSAHYDPTKFERPSVAVDVVLLSIDLTDSLCAVLVRRKEHPDKGAWALPGGFVRIDESLDAAAARILNEKAKLRRVFLEQLYTFGAVHRDPRTRVITVAHYALVDFRRLAASYAHVSDDLVVARLDVPWSGEAGGAVRTLDERAKPLRLAFDHARILGLAVKRIRGKLNYAPIGFELLPEAFTLFELQRVHQAVLGRKLNKDSFRRKILASGLIEPTGAAQTNVGHRPPALYHFLKEQGANHG